MRKFLQTLLFAVLSAAACAASAVHAEELNAAAVPVLLYHKISLSPGEGGETVISLSKFEEQMQYLADEHYTTVTVDDLRSFMKGKKQLPPKSVVLSFDDGWRSQQRALPILRAKGFKASFWLFPKGGISDAYGDYLTWRQVKAIAHTPGFEIGSHSLTHPYDRKSNLVTWADGKTPRRSLKDAVYELTESKRVLEKRLKVPVKYFAWPCGWYNEALIREAKHAGYKALLTVNDGANHPGDDVFQVKRIFIDGACSFDDFKETLTTFRYKVCQTRERPSIGSSPYTAKQRVESNLE